MSVAITYSFGRHTKIRSEENILSQLAFLVFDQPAQKEKSGRRRSRKRRRCVCVVVYVEVFFSSLRRRVTETLHMSFRSHNAILIGCGRAYCLVNCRSDNGFVSRKLAFVLINQFGVKWKIYSHGFHFKVFFCGLQIMMLPRFRALLNNLFCWPEKQYQICDLMQWLSFFSFKLI